MNKKQKELNNLKTEHKEFEFNDEQKVLIQEGCELGLSPEQIEIYANAEFSVDQMNEVFWGFVVGLTIEQVKSYADPKLTIQEMIEERKKIQRQP